MAKRRCGPCAACCVVLAIEELKKPGYVTCSHLRQRANHRCGEYDRRPATCMRYDCLWRRHPQLLPEAARPDLVGLLLDAHDLPSGRQALRATEVRAGAATTGYGRQLLQNLSRQLSVWVLEYGRQTPSLEYRDRIAIPRTEGQTRGNLSARP